MCRVTIQTNRNTCRQTTETNGLSSLSSTKHRGPYNKFGKNQQLKSTMLKWWMDEPVEFRPWCKKWSLIPRGTLQRHLQNSGLLSMRIKQADVAYSIHDAEAVVNNYVEDLNKSKKNRTGQAIQSNRFLADKEEESITNLVVMLSSMGLGLTKNDLLNIIGCYVNLDEDEHQSIGVSDRIFQDLKKKHSDKLKVVSAGSLDPLRARKATEETRYTMFFKLAKSHGPRTMISQSHPYLIWMN